MNETRLIATWGLSVLIILFTVAIYGDPTETSTTVTKTETVKVELPAEHPGGYELLMASIQNNE